MNSKFAAAHCDSPEAGGEVIRRHSPEAGGEVIR